MGLAIPAADLAGEGDLLDDLGTLDAREPKRGRGNARKQQIGERRSRDGDVSILEIELPMLLEGSFR